MEMKKFVNNAIWFVGGMVLGVYTFTEMQMYGFKNGLAYYKFKNGNEYGDPSIVNSDSSKQETEEEEVPE
jgi:hypothetical protein